MPKVRKQATAPKSRPKSRSVVDRIGPIRFNADDGIKINIYGKSGTGKTTTWATFPKPILAIVCSGGSQSGELRSIDTPEYRKTIRQVMLETSSEIQDLANHQRNGAKFATVVLDHVTGLQEMILKEVLGLDEIPSQLSWGVATQQQYGQVSLQTKERLRSLLDLSCNVVIVAQEREFNIESESDIVLPYVGSALTPSSAGWLHTAADYICQTFKRSRTETKLTKVGTKTVHTKKAIGGVDYCLRTAPDPTFTTKFRLPKGTELPDVIVDPTYNKLSKLIHRQ